MTDKWKHIRPSEYNWDYFKDTNGRETSMVRTLITGDEYIWEGQTITVSGDLVYTYLGANVSGCDSTHTLTIDINYSNAGDR